MIVLTSGRRMVPAGPSSGHVLRGLVQTTNLVSPAHVMPSGNYSVPRGSVVGQLLGSRVLPGAARGPIADVRPQIASIRRMISLPVQTQRQLLGVPIIRHSAYGAYGSNGGDSSLDWATEEGQRVLRLISDALEKALDDGINGHDPNYSSSQLGAGLLAQRAGELAASLNLPIMPQDLVRTAGTEARRLYQRAAGMAREVALRMSIFDQVLANAEAAGIAMSQIRDAADSIRGVYGDVITDLEALKQSVCDAARMAEGGLRRVLEDGFRGVISDANLPAWMNRENLSKAGRNIEMWMGAVESGEWEDYVTAAGATVSLAGSVLPGPAGAICAAVGGLIAMVGKILAVFSEKPEPPPAYESCTKNYTEPWHVNPEAWYALEMGYCALHPEFLSSVRNPLQRIQALAEDGWHAQIDAYTGEVMVRRPLTEDATGIYRRWLDVFPRGQIASPMQLYHPLSPRVHWCQPDPYENLTRFINAEQTARDAGFKAFRVANEITTINGSQTAAWHALSCDTAPEAYGRAMALSLWLCGAPAYGMKYPGGEGFLIATACGGIYGKNQDDELVSAAPIWLRTTADEHGHEFSPEGRWYTFRSALVCGVKVGTEPVVIPSNGRLLIPSVGPSGIGTISDLQFDEFVSLLADESKLYHDPMTGQDVTFRELNRIPDSSPPVYGGGSVVRHLARVGVRPGLVRVLPGLLSGSGKSKQIKIGSVTGSATVVKERPYTLRSAVTFPLGASLPALIDGKAYLCTCAAAGEDVSCRCRKGSKK